MKTMTRILVFVAILPFRLLGLLMMPVLKLAEAIGELWQSTGGPPEHGMYARVSIKMKEQHKNGGNNGLV